MTLTGQFDVPATSATGTDFTNTQSTEVAYTFSSSDTWTPDVNNPSLQQCGPEGVASLDPAVQDGLTQAVPDLQTSMKYPNNTSFALVAENLTTGAVTTVGKKATIVLKPGEKLRFVLNDVTWAYADNTGSLKVDWSGSTLAYIDAALNWDSNIAYVFKGNQFIRYSKSADKAEGGAGLIKSPGNWTGLEPFADGIDAAISWNDTLAYFFKGNQYIRYNKSTNKAEGEPKPIAGNWPGLDPFAGGIDAAVNWDSKTAYFFKGGQYMRYDKSAGKAVSINPVSIVGPGSWPGLQPFADGIDAAVEWGNGIIYFFKGNQYIRFDITTNKAYAGYPKPIDNTTWPGLAFK